MKSRQKNRYHICGSVIRLDISTKRHPKTIATIDHKDMAIVLDGGARWLASKNSEHDLQAQAARAYDAAAHRYFGRFASPNFPVSR